MPPVFADDDEEKQLEETNANILDIQQYESHIPHDETMGAELIRGRNTSVTKSNHSIRNILDDEDGSSDGSNNDREEEAFLASQRESQRKLSNPTSKQNSAGYSAASGSAGGYGGAGSAGRCSHKPILRIDHLSSKQTNRLITQTASLTE